MTSCCATNPRATLQSPTARDLLETFRKRVFDLPVESGGDLEDSLDAIPMSALSLLLWAVSCVGYRWSAEFDHTLRCCVGRIEWALHPHLKEMVGISPPAPVEAGNVLAGADLALLYTAYASTNLDLVVDLEHAASMALDDMSLDHLLLMAQGMMRARSQNAALGVELTRRIARHVASMRSVDVPYAIKAMSYLSNHSLGDAPALDTIRERMVAVLLKSTFDDGTFCGLCQWSCSAHDL